MEDILKQILNEIKDLKSGQEELKLPFKAQLEAIEKTNAELSGFREDTSERFDHIERQNRFFDSDLEHLNKEVNKIKRDLRN